MFSLLERDVDFKVILLLILQSTYVQTVGVLKIPDYCKRQP